MATLDPKRSASPPPVPTGERTDVQTARELEERVKELAIFHLAARLLDEDREPGEVLKQIVRALPDAWQHPEAAVARIGFDGLVVSSAGFVTTPWMQRAEFVTRTEQTGFIEVGYRTKLGADDEDPFLPEEQELIESLAGLLKSFFEGQHAEHHRVRRLQAEAQTRLARDAERAKNEFLAMTTHELRNPLQVMKGWVSLLKEPLDEATRMRGLQVLEENISLQAKLVEDLLDLSRIQAGRLSLTTGPVDLAELVLITADSARPGTTSKSIDLRVEIASVGMCTGDRHRLGQVLSNLLHNAIKFTPLGGSIGVRLTQDGGCAHLVVWDNGAGISSELLPHIFDRFRQGRQTQQSGGLGLGLAISQHLVQMHRGTIVARSDGPGRGASFHVMLPLDGETTDRT